MWNLTKVSASNICAFKEFSYEPAQGVATLVFGRNLDDDSQDSNGSGKSALIESIAIALLGSPLRKAKLEEVINDRQNEAAIEVTLSNPVLDQTLDITRTLSRKSDQKVALKLNGAEVVMPNVAEYNRYILEAVGLTRDQILTTFILCAYHFRSFLDTSDKEKKEIINRFSNGAMVDQSIESVRSDLMKAKEDLVAAEKEHAIRQTRVETMQREIQEFGGQHEYREQRRLEMIEAHKESIAKLNGSIRNANKDINTCNEELDTLDEADSELTALEEVNKDIGQLQDSIRTLLDKYRIKTISNRYFDKYLQAEQYLSEYEKKLEDVHKEMAVLSVKVNNAEKEYQNASREYGFAKAGYDSSLDSLTEKRLKSGLNLEDCNSKLEDARGRVDNIIRDIRNLDNLLASSITCPACKHKFVLSSKKSYDELQADRKELEGQKKQNEDSLSKLEFDIAVINKEIADIDNKVRDIKVSLLKIQDVTEQAGRNFKRLSNQFGDCNHSEARYSQAMESARKTLTETRKEMFDEAFANLDYKSSDLEAQMDKLDKDIQIYKEQIKTYEEAIAGLEKADVDLDVVAMKDKLKAYENAAVETAGAVNGIKADVERLTAQEMRFLSFKTYLANKKIEALSQETNNFLEHIGSSLRIRFSGFTVLKTGKVRDKISVSMERDGIDCGSFGKLSVGERSRGILANVLAMHRLCNANCPDGRGLNFLILDEILDSTDETGISRTADVLSDLGLTSIIITHIPVADSYPYRLIVTKQNGISTIDNK